MIPSALRWIRARITVRLTLTMLFASLGPLAVAGVVVLRLMEDSLREQVDKRREQVAAAGELAVRGYLDRGLDKLRSMSLIVGEEPTTPVQEYGRQSNRHKLQGLKPEELTVRLNRFIAPSDLFIHIAYRSAEEERGEARNQNAAVQRADLNEQQQRMLDMWNFANVESRSALVASVLDGRDYVSNVVTRSEDLVFLPMAVPIRDEAGRVFAMLSATLDLRPVARALEELAQDGRALALLDARGDAIFRTGPIPAEPLETQRALPHGGWRVVVQEPRAAAFAPLARVRLQALGLIGASGALAFTLSLLLAAWIVRPVRRLTLAADAMKAGALGTRSGIERDDEIGRLAQSFDRMAAALEELDRMKSDFVAHVSHELRTPLTAMQLAVANLQDGVAGPLGEKPLEVLRRVGGDIERLIRLVNEVLDVARIEAGRLELARERVELGEVVRGAAAILEPLARERGVALDVAAEPCIVDGDRSKLHQVVTNLVDNAIKFTSRGGRVAVGLAGGVLTVADTGSGIAPEHLPRIFDRFARAGATNAGAGLGLSISRRIVELHGGTIVVESRPGKGSTFTVTLPCHASSS